jgi:hypothetical protein
VLVVDDHGLHTLQGNVYYILDVLKALVGGGLAPGLLQIEPKVVDAPFETVFGVVVVSILLDGHIGQVNNHVVQVRDLVRVLLSAEPSETLVAEPDLEWPIAGHEHVDTEIKLLATDKKWVVDISRDNVSFLHHLGLERQLGGVGPFLQLFELVDQEDTLTLSS